MDFEIISKSIGSGNLQDVKQLIDAGIPLYNENRLVLSCAVKLDSYRRTPMIKLLIDNGAPFNTYRNVFLHTLFSSECDDDLIELIEYCVNNGCDVFKVDFHGRTALDWAKKCARRQIARGFISENRLLAIEYLESLMYKCALKNHKGPGF
jgi:ankyrin repeat protein